MSLLSRAKTKQVKPKDIIYKNSFSVSLEMGRGRRAYSQRKTNETYLIKSENDLLNHL